MFLSLRADLARSQKGQYVLEKTITLLSLIALRQKWQSDRGGELVRDESGGCVCVLTRVCVCACVCQRARFV